MSILKEILSGVSKSKSVLVSDTADYSGENLVDAFIKKYAQNNTKIMLLIFDEFGSDIDRHSNSKITAKYIIDKPEEWVKQDSQKLNLKSHLPHDSKYAVVIDSLSTALIKFDAQELYLQLVELIQHENVIQLVCQMHQDVVDPAESKFIRSLFSTEIIVEPPARPNSFPTFNLQHYKPNGKFFTEKRIFFCDEDGELKIQSLASEEPEKAKTELVSRPVHDTFSTFRHGLSAEEQRARENLILPYQRITLDGLPPRGEGKIEYEPEEDDEWDEEEDPDDDLEI